MVASTGVADDTLAWPLALELAACLCAEVNPTGSMCFCGVWPSTRAPYELAAMCAKGNCGAGFVRLDQGYPSTENFPGQDGVANCASLVAFRFAVGVLRCYPVGSGGSSPAPPSNDKIAEWAQWQYADMAAIRRAIKCCMVDKFDDLDYVLGSYTPLVPQAGVSGGQWMVTIRQAF